MSAQIPLPSFDDIRKILQFWIDQQDRWFYFETESIHTGSMGESEVPAPLYAKTMTRALSNQTNQFIQSRIVGNIHDIISYPPSLLLVDTFIFTVRLDYELNSRRLISKEKRAKYGLVFSQITYYEPIDEIEIFLNGDKRVN